MWSPRDVSSSVSSLSNTYLPSSFLSIITVVFLMTIYHRNRPCHNVNMIIEKLNSFAPGRCGSNSKSIVFKLFIHIRSLGTRREIVLRWMPQNLHDDVIKWKYFPCYWPFVRGVNRSPVNSPHKGQWRGALVFSLICAWTNGWVHNRRWFETPSRPLWRHCNALMKSQHCGSGNGIVPSGNKSLPEWTPTEIYVAIWFQQ